MVLFSDQDFLLYIQNNKLELTQLTTFQLSAYIKAISVNISTYFANANIYIIVF